MSNNVVTHFGQLREGIKLVHRPNKKNTIKVTNLCDASNRHFTANWVWFGEYKKMNNPGQNGSFYYPDWEIIYDHKEFTDEEYESLLV